MISKKEYALIAAAIRTSLVRNYTNLQSRVAYNNGVDNVAHNMATALALNDAHFNREDFLAACKENPHVRQH